MYKEPKHKIGDIVCFFAENENNLCGMIKGITIVGIFEGENIILYDIAVGDNLDTKTMVCDKMYHRIPEKDIKERRL